MTNRIWRISLLMILSGLLFSPAEGICLLPFDGSPPATASDNYFGSGLNRYQVAIKHFGIESGSDRANRSISKSDTAKMCTATDLKIELRFGPICPSADRSAKSLFCSSKCSCELRSRPPPPSFE